MKVSLTISMCMLQNIGFSMHQTRFGALTLLLTLQDKVNAQSISFTIKSNLFLHQNPDLAYPENQCTWRQKLPRSLKVNAPDRIWCIDFCVLSTPGASNLVFKILRCIDFRVPPVPGASILCFKISRCIDFWFSKTPGASILLVLFYCNSLASILVLNFQSHFPCLPGEGL